MLQEFDFGRQIGRCLSNFANGKTPQPLRDHDHVAVGLAQQFQDDDRRSDLVEISHIGLLFRFVALRDEANDLVLRQRFVQQLNRRWSLHIEGRNGAGKNDKAAHRQNGEGAWNRRHFLHRADLRRAGRHRRIRLRSLAMHSEVARSFLEGQFDPEKSVALLGPGLIDIDRHRQLDDSFEGSVVDLERNHLYGATFVAGRLGGRADAAQDDALRLYRQIDLRTIDTGQLDADSQTFVALEGIDRRLPAIWRRRGEMQPGQLVGHVAQRFVQPA